MINLGMENYEVHKEDKIAQLIVKRIATEEEILVEQLETNERGEKEFGSTDTKLIKQVRTGVDLLTKSTTQGRSTLKGTTQGTSQGMPRLRRTSLQVGTGVNLLTDQSQKDIGRSDNEGSHNQHPKVAKDPLSKPSQEASKKL